ncbi:hypothetical protein CRENBAI_018290 [Crenichthys baileyi]|uniref:Uncharacterized protein n=1 Tax=Crenichthys baileyi TaxID=28760 RepID=A0AAV9RQT8_9TELE
MCEEQEFLKHSADLTVAFSAAAASRFLSYKSLLSRRVQQEAASKRRAGGHQVQHGAAERRTERSQDISCFASFHVWIHAAPGVFLFLLHLLPFLVLCSSLSFWTLCCTLMLTLLLAC